MGGCTARLFAQNFDAVLVVIVICAGDAIFVKFYEKCLKHVKLHISRYMGCGFFHPGAVFWGSAVDSKGSGPGPGPGHGPGLVLVLGPALGPARSWPWHPKTDKSRHPKTSPDIKGTSPDIQI